MKKSIFAIGLIGLLAACTADGDGILPNTEEQQESRAVLQMPLPDGLNLHTNLQGEWTRDDITFIGDLILGGWGGCYMKISQDTIFLYSMHRGVDFDWNGDTDKERTYICVCDFDTIPYTFQDPNLLIAETDTFTVYENKEAGAYFLLGKQRNFKLTEFHFDKSSYPEDVEYRINE